MRTVVNMIKRQTVEDRLRRGVPEGPARSEPPLTPSQAARRGGLSNRDTDHPWRKRSFKRKVRGGG